MTQYKYNVEIQSIMGSIGRLWMLQKGIYELRADIYTLKVDESTEKPIVIDHSWTKQSIIHSLQTGCQNESDILIIFWWTPSSIVEVGKWK